MVREIVVDGRSDENRSEFTAYLYEAKLSWVIPCFEIYVRLRKAKA